MPSNVIMNHYNLCQAVSFVENTVIFIKNRYLQAEAMFDGLMHSKKTQRFSL